MGDWRTVKMTGQIDKASVDELKAMCDGDNYDWRNEEQKAVFPFLMSESLCGLNVWVNKDGKIDACGNLSERDIELEDILSALAFLSSKFQSLDLKVHAGDNYESTTCVATFVAKDGHAEQLDPEIEEIPEISASMMNARFLSMLSKR